MPFFDPFKKLSEGLRSWKSPWGFGNVQTSGEIYESGYLGGGYIIIRGGLEHHKVGKIKNILENPGEHDIQEHHKGIITLKKKYLTWFHMHGSLSAWGKISCFEISSRLNLWGRSHGAMATDDDFMFTFLSISKYDTPQKTKKMSSKKGQFFNRIYIWTNHWFSVDMLVFEGVTMILIVISCTTMKLRFSVNKSLNFPNLLSMHAPLELWQSVLSLHPFKVCKDRFQDPISWWWVVLDPTA